MGIIERAADKLKHTDTTIISQNFDASMRQNSQQATENSQIPRKNAKRVVIDLEKMREVGMVTPDMGRSSISEEFRAIKRSLIAKSFETPRNPLRPNNLIMVTSSLAGEGKTFCATNLAMSIAAEMDHTVLLVDADVAHPSVLKTFGLEPEAGLMDVLLDSNLDVADVMLKTNVDTLTILPAGRSHAHATELLASQAMSKLLIELANRYPDRVVIFDSPPLLLTTEAAALAQQMGQIILVVEAESTTQSALQNSLGKIKLCGNVALIYNKARLFQNEERYGYYYN